MPGAGLILYLRAVAAVDRRATPAANEPDGAFGEEMPRATPLHRVLIGGARCVLLRASLLLCHSHVLFAQVYPAWDFTGGGSHCEAFDAPGVCRVTTGTIAGRGPSGSSRFRVAHRGSGGGELGRCS